jgi:deoxyhypusine monooxygenase
MIIIEHYKVPEYASTLQDIDKPITDRISSLFCLRTVCSVEAIDALTKAFELEPKSDLLRHEICYCLGQMNTSPDHAAKIQPFLEKILSEDHPKIVLHEAVEALGNLSMENTLKLLERFKDE